MRKQLMVGTALVAATMLVAGGAAGADKKMMKPSISVNGYYEGVVGGIIDETQETGIVRMPAAQDGTLPETTAASAMMDDMMDTSAIDTRTDSEVHFNGRATLDNGVNIHARWELEGQYNHSTSDRIDEYFLSVSGSFGSITLGGTEGVAVKMLTGFSGSWATGVGENLSFDDAWVPTATASKLFETVRHSRLGTGDGEKMTYISPKFGGFQVGLTYEPRVSNNDDNARVDAQMDRHDAVHMAASFSGTFGGVGFGAGAGYLSAQGSNDTSSANAGDMAGWIVAGRVDFGGGVRMAAAYKQTDDPMAVRGSLIDLGVRYVAGANKFSIAGMRGTADSTDAEHTKVIVSYARAMGPGVTWHSNVIWNDSRSAASTSNVLGTDGEPIADQANPGGNDYRETSQSENSGIALVTGIKVAF